MKYSALSLSGLWHGFENIRATHSLTSFKIILPYPKIYIWPEYDDGLYLPPAPARPVKG
jgi:hypothetical protein